MNLSTRYLHKRLQSIFEMIERCDKLISLRKKEMEKYKDSSWRNGHAREANRYVKIRARLEFWYADVFVRATKAVLEYNNAKPASLEDTRTVRQMINTNMAIAEEHANQN